MSEFCIYVKVPLYEKEWCEHHFGKPCKFPSQSNINSVIRHFLRTTPKGCTPRQQQPGELAIVIPYSSSKHPRDYNYLSIPGREAVSEAINDLFTIHMFEGLTDPGCRKVKLSKLILDWMLCNGISQDNYDNMRQKFTRIKEAYRKEADINISRGYKHENN